MMTTRLKFLLITAIIVAWFSFFTKEPSDMVVQSVERNVPTRQQSEIVPTTTSIKKATPIQAEPAIKSMEIAEIALRINFIGHQDFQGTPVDLFRSQNWNSPPPPPAPVQVAMQAAPPTPMAPPIPFKLIGKKLDGEIWEIFLARGNMVFVVRQNDVIEGTYKIGKIAPPSMELTFLPLNQIQTLSIGNAD